MTKIVYITGDSSLTGAPLHILQLAKNLKPKGYDILIITSPGKLVELCKKEKLSVVEIPMRGPLDWGAVRSIEKKLRQFKPDIVHTHGIRAGWLGRLASRTLKCKKVYTEHLWTSTFHLKNLAYEQFQLRGLRFMDRYTDTTIAVSQTVYDFLVKKRGFDKKKIHIIPNGINSRFIKAQVIQKPKEVPFLIGSVGSLNTVKNHQTAIRAVAKVIRENPRFDVHYQIVGDGPLRKALERLIKQEGMEKRIHLTGRVDDVLDRLQHFNIFVSLSLSESFGMAVAEAMAIGLPVIVSDISALKNLVGDAGTTVPPRNQEKITEKIVGLIKSEKMRKGLGQKAKERIRENFSEEAMIDKTIELYKNTLG